jgi:SAM-dependent methyltransferase
LRGIRAAAGDRLTSVAQPATPSEVYAASRAYELAFSYRDFAAELDALLGWATDASSTDPRSALELAAGPADHALGLAARGLDVTALDLSARMCARATERAAERGLSLKVVEADMRAFNVGRAFDLIITMVDSTTHLLTLDDMLGYLGCVARHLQPGGCLVMEMSHPRDVFGSSPITSSDWTMSSEGQQVRMQWGSPDGEPDEFDPVSQITQTRVRIDYTAPNAPPFSATETVPSRTWTACDVEAALRLSGEFDVLGQFGSFNGLAMDAPDAWRMITVLRKR